VCLLAALVVAPAQAADLPVRAGSYFDNLNITSLTGRVVGGSFTVKRLTVDLCRSGTTISLKEKEKEKERNNTKPNWPSRRVGDGGGPQQCDGAGAGDGVRVGLRPDQEVQHVLHGQRVHHLRTEHRHPRLQRTLSLPPPPISAQLTQLYLAFHLQSFSGSLNALSSTAKVWVGGNCSLTSPNTSYSYGACNLNTGSPPARPSDVGRLLT
jgi:hypothetical protein